jgi:hypothetical protein
VDPTCAGTKTYTFTYTNCDGTTKDWIYTYTIAAPTFTLPAPGASSVACLADAVMPIPPTVTDNCGNAITPSAGVPGVDPTCAGTKTFTFTYTNCDGTPIDWIYTYTVAAPILTLPAAGASSVACLADAVMPTPPTVTDNCGNAITPSTGVAGVDPICAGTKTYTFTYTNCDGTTVDWINTLHHSGSDIYTAYTSASSVACITDAVMPTPPAVTDNCGNAITPSAGVPGIDPTCAGTKTYTFSYTNCDGTTVDWIYTYTVAAPTFTLPAPGSSSVPVSPMR